MAAIDANNSDDVDAVSAGLRSRCCHLAACCIPAQCVCVCVESVMVSNRNPTGSLTVVLVVRVCDVPSVPPECEP